MRRWHGFAELKVLPKTGRTHQIRVHLAHVGCPVLCDRLYSGRSQITYGQWDVQPAQAEEVLLKRVALHARRLELIHPSTNAPIAFEAPVPEDIQRTIDALSQYATHR